MEIFPKSIDSGFNLIIFIALSTLNVIEIWHFFFLYNIFHVTVGVLDASIGLVQDAAKSSDNHSDIQVEPSVTLPHPPISVPTSVPPTGGVTSHYIAGSMSTSTCDDKDFLVSGDFWTMLNYVTVFYLEWTQIPSKFYKQILI